MPSRPQRAAPAPLSSRPELAMFLQGCRGNPQTRKLRYSSQCSERTKPNYWIGGCGLVTITVTSQLITRVGLFCESHPPDHQPGSGCHPGRDCLKHRHLVIRNQRHGIRTMTAAQTHPCVFCLPVPNTHPWVAYTQARAPGSGGKEMRQRRSELSPGGEMAAQNIKA